MIVPGAARSRWTSVAVWSMGLALLAAAVVAVWKQSDAIAQAWRSLEAQRWAILPLIALPVVCLALASLSFLVLTRRFGRVGIGEMFALLGAAWLLNYLPLKPGVAGRVAYHAAVNGISVQQSIFVVLQTIAVGLACFGTQFALALALATFTPTSGEVVRGCVLLTPVVCAAIAWAVLSCSKKSQHAWRYAASFLFRYLDSLVWGLRYALALHLTGGTPSVSGCAAIASASQFSALVPIGGNAIGLREWVVGYATYVLGKGFPQGLAAELLNRSGEVVASIPVGLACVWWVARRLKTHRNQAPSTEK